MSPSIVVLVLTLVCSVQDVVGSKNGIIGFGISLYQDLCCQACHDSLSALYLSCTTFSDDMSGMDMSGMDMDGPMGTTSEDCYASNEPWLQTMAYCIQQNCNAEGYPAGKQAKCFSVQAVGGSSSPTLQDSLPAIAPTTELPADAMWLNETSLVNRDLYYSTYGSEKEFARSEYIHTRYSVILYLLVIGACIVCGAVTQTSIIYPKHRKQVQASRLRSKIQQYITLPGLFGSRHLEPLPVQIGYVPSRILSIFIAIYVILNIIFSSVSFGSFQPNTMFLSKGFELCEYVGNRTGTLSLVNMSIAILFAGRNNLLIAITGWSQTTFLTLHRWIARVAAVQAVVHSIVYTLAYFEPAYDGASAYAAKAAEPFYWWGIIATIAMCLALGFAVLPLRIRFYEFFLVTHVVLVILTLVGCWYHLVPHFGYDYGYQVWLYICFAFWSADRVARVARVLYYSRLGGSTATVEAVPGTDIMHITAHPRVWSFGPGQHSFLYFPGLGKFWENHPFSVAGWTRTGRQGLGSGSHSSGDQDRETKSGATITTQVQDRMSIHFMVRTHAGATASLQRRLLSSSGSRFETSVYTEGPYAGHRASHASLFSADTVICLIGGIGITSALGFVQGYADSRPRDRESATHGRTLFAHTKRFILAWSAKELALIEHVKKNFLVDVEGIEYTLWHTGDIDDSGVKAKTLDDDIGQKDKTATPTEITPVAATAVTSGRMDIGDVLGSSLEVGHQTTVIVCGPGGMADEARRKVVACIKDGFKVDLVEEAYAW